MRRCSPRRGAHVVNLSCGTRIRFLRIWTTSSEGRGQVPFQGGAIAMGCGLIFRVTFFCCCTNVWRGLCFASMPGHRVEGKRATLTLWIRRNAVFIFGIWAMHDLRTWLQTDATKRANKTHVFHSVNLWTLSDYFVFPSFVSKTRFKRGEAQFS